MHNKNEEEFESQYREMFGLTHDDLPALMIIIIHKQTYKFKFEKEMTLKNVAEFLNDFA